ncbi:MAG: sensor histidine kinase [Vicinamibacterales bacterium]
MAITRALRHWADRGRRTIGRGSDVLVTRPLVAMSLAAVLLLVTGLLFLFGYRATREWQRSSAESAQRRGNEVLVLLGAALERDMRDALTTTIVPFNTKILQTSSRYDLADRFAGAFARFPYLESFFAWRRAGWPETTTYFFNRADQPPLWDRSEADTDMHPVLIRADPPAGRPLIARAHAEALRGTRFSVFDQTVEGVPYQVVVHQLFGGQAADDVIAFVGFTVNLNRVRESYFEEFIQHVQALVGDASLTIEIADGRGATVARAGPDLAGAPVGQKAFPLLFADRSLLEQIEPGAEREVPWWTARVSVVNEASGQAADRASTRTLLVLVLAAAVTVGGLAWSVRAARAAAALATAQSEFVSAMNHEMKAPLSLIRLASNTLAHGRYTSAATVPEYGRMLGREVHHLGQLIDNVLCYARLNTADATPGETIDAAELIQDSVERFRPLLTDLGIEVQVQLPIDAVWIRADRGMLVHAIDNLIDNAAKHGGTGRRLVVRAALEDRCVRIDVADAGQGIPTDELPRVFETFYRGHGTRARGSGLGLTIVRRIVDAHGGTVAVTSRVGEGTTVTILLPVSQPPAPAPSPSAV